MSLCIVRLCPYVLGQVASMYHLNLKFSFTHTNLNGILTTNSDGLDQSSKLINRGLLFSFLYFQYLSLNQPILSVQTLSLMDLLSQRKLCLKVHAPTLSFSIVVEEVERARVSQVVGYHRPNSCHPKVIRKTELSHPPQVSYRAPHRRCELGYFICLQPITQSRGGINQSCSISQGPYSV